MHFTYDSLDRDLLYQGDVLKRTEPLVTTIKAVHPHFADPKYTYFMVLTQSCDLVRRSNKDCKARYVTVAAVRPLRKAIERELESLQYDEVERELKFCEESRKAKLVQFMERLMNNNEPDYFFLFQEQTFGLKDDLCAFLQLTIPLKTSLHYDTLLGAKILQLKESFQHKLGSLVGAIYSRIGTDDWLPGNCDAVYFKDATTRPLENEDLVLWLDKEIHKKVVSEMKVLPPDERTIDCMKAIIERLKQAKVGRLDEILNTIANTLVQLGVEPGVVQNATQRLKNEPSFTTRVK
jgi:hypothetical protein